MKKMAKCFITICVVFIFSHSDCSSQENEIDLLNEVIAELKGNQGSSDIETFRSIAHACSSQYISCNKKGEIIGLDFQFSNLNGSIPKFINELENLEYINLEYNYLDGTIPEGLSQLNNLEELILNGNFLEGPLPGDFNNFHRKVNIDLSKNTISSIDKKTDKLFNIKDQVNLLGCRHPDSIFLDMPDKSEYMNKETVEEMTEEVEKSNPKVVQEMPRFPGCEDEKMSEDERMKCSQTKLIQFVYKNLRYPYNARINGIEGNVYAQFTILENGDIGYAQVVKDIGGRCGNAALWVINRMNFTCEKWVPGMQDGDPVKVLFTLPVKFRLE